MTFNDRAGVRYGMLVAIEPVKRKSKSGELIWKCRCNCGGVSEVLGGHLTSGHTVSCGCFLPISISARTRTHGESSPITPEYRAWKHINNRCHNPKNKSYSNYGGRGIVVCKRWRDSYESFLKDMGRRPSPKLQVERINNNGNYEPGNCTWSTRKAQANNKRSNVYISHAGVVKTLAQWSETIKVRYNIVRKRIVQHKWTMAEIIDRYADSRIRKLWNPV